MDVFLKIAARVKPGGGKGPSRKKSQIKIFEALICSSMIHVPLELATSTKILVKLEKKFWTPTKTSDYL